MIYILFQGMAFSLQERQILGIHGLLPATVKSQDEQLELCRLNLDRYDDDLSKYIYLIGLLVCINYFIFFFSINILFYTYTYNNLERCCLKYLK